MHAHQMECHERAPADFTAKVTGSYKDPLSRQVSEAVLKGKFLTNNETLFDYSVNLNDMIQLWKREPLADQRSK